MKILAIEHDNPAADAEAYKPYLKEEASRVWELYQAGVIREMYFRQDRSEAVLMLECGSLDDARNILASLPLVRQGLIEFEVIPLGPYPGYARLFAS